MRQPGRVSVEAASVILPPEATQPTDRPAPPPHLRESEAKEWAAIVVRLGSQWLPPEAHALLTAYSVIKVQLDDVHAAFAAFGPRIPEDRPGWQRYRELTKLRGQLSGQLSSLATKLRLTPQARYDRHWCGAEARRRASRPPPWSLGDEDPMVG